MSVLGCQLRSVRQCGTQSEVKGLILLIDNSFLFATFVLYSIFHSYSSHFMNFSSSCLTGFKSDSIDVMINELSVCLFVGMYLLFL